MYPLIDLDTCQRAGLPLLAFAAEILSLRPVAVQLRAKGSNPRETLECLRALLPLCRAAGVPLFANDRPDLAVLAGADGVHVGQSDLPLAEVRRFAPSLRVGVSTHVLAELDAALDASPDYVAFGPVFATASKANHEPTVGIAGLALAHERAQAAGIPLVAIGGLTLENAPEAAAHAEALAVIGALVDSGGSLATTARKAQTFAQAVFGFKAR